jgi:hypothetical protein
MNYLETNYIEEYPDMIESNRQEILRYESIRQLYLDDKRLDADWVNNRIDNLIDKANERLARFTRLMHYQQRQSNF